MARRRYLIAYDISDPKRLRRVLKVMEAVGERLQYSVFLCDLSGMEHAHWEASLREVVHMREDSVVCIDLGPVHSPAALTVYGNPRRLPGSGSTVI